MTIDAQTNKIILLINLKRGGDYLKKIAWLDTLRVAAAVLVIVVHFLMCDAFRGTYIGSVFSYDLGVVIIAVFLAVSGYLIPASLERAPNLFEFYWRKAVRIIVPFTVSYFVMTALAIIPAKLNDTFGAMVPLNVVRQGGKLSHMIYGMFPVDLNIVRFFGSDIYWFVGEWFMWVILWLYLVSPLLYKAAKKFPLQSLPAAIVVGCIVYYATKPLELAGRIHGSDSIFIVRIIEFMMGMLLYMYRDKLMKVRFPLVLLFMGGLTLYTIYYVVSFDPANAPYFPINPTRYLISLPMTYLLFVLAEIICSSRLKIIEWFNSFSGVSYLAMIVQHVIIFFFADFVGFEGRSPLELTLILLMIIVITFKLAAQIKKLTDPIERALTNI